MFLFLSFVLGTKLCSIYKISWICTLVCVCYTSIKFVFYSV